MIVKNSRNGQKLLGKQSEIRSITGAIWNCRDISEYTGYLNEDTAEEVWNLCNKKLQEDDMSVRNIIRKSNVKLICTTDNPVDDLKWHKVLCRG